MTRPRRGTTAGTAAKEVPGALENEARDTHSPPGGLPRRVCALLASRVRGCGTPLRSPFYLAGTPALLSASWVRIGRLVERRVVDDRHRVEADLRGDPGQQLVLGREVALHMRDLVQGRAGVVEGRLRALVRGVGLY